MVLPSALTLDIALTQININTQLIFRVTALKQSIIQLNSNADVSLKSKELLLYIIIYILILVYPILFTVEFVINEYPE
jgi:hypothetical protein